MSDDATSTGRDLLQHLREEGFRVRSDGEKLLHSPAIRLDGYLRSRLKDAKPALLDALRREAVERLLDLAAVDPETGLPHLPADKPATPRQVERLREVAAHPAFGDNRERVREIVENTLDRGLSQLGAWGLLGELGRRIACRREQN